MTIGLIANNDGTGAVQLGGSNAISLDTSLNATMAGYVNAPNTFGFKNRIINGNMVVSQYYGTSSSTPIGDGYFIDRWRDNCTQGSKFTRGQNLNSVTPPTGFVNYAGIQIAATASVGATDIFAIRQGIEGYNIADLAWGTASAAPVTLSFWVRSNTTGTFGGSILNSTAARSYPFTYTINAANTWEYKTVTIPGDTSGTWLTTNGTGINLFFGLGVGTTYSGTAGTWAGSTYYSATGATSLMSSTSNVFYITGVQLEKGSTATSFDVRSIGTEFALAQRYYCQGSFCSLHPQATTSFGASARNTLYIPPPRTTPTCTAAGNGAVTGLAVTPYLDTSGGCVIYFTGTATGSALVNAWTASSEL